MSILEQVLALGEQLTPEERLRVAEEWYHTPESADDLDNDYVISDETKRYLDDIQARIARGDMTFYTTDEVFSHARNMLRQRKEA